MEYGVLLKMGVIKIMVRLVRLVIDIVLCIGLYEIYKSIQSDDRQQVFIILMMVLFVIWPFFTGWVKCNYLKGRNHE